MAKAQTYVVTRTTDPTYVRVFGTAKEAVETVGPNYAKDGYVISGFERKTETYFAPMDPEELADRMPAKKDEGSTMERAFQQVR